MYNFGKAGFDPGHYAGANAGPGPYREGDVMLRLGLMLRSTYDTFLTRTDGKDISLQKRARLAADAGVDTLISLHTNAPQAAAGVIVFYSVRHPDDKPMAEHIGSEIASAMGIKFRGAATKPLTSNPQVDYYGIIRNPVKMGIDHPFIVEHGSHWEMAVNMDDKLASIVETYGRVLQLGKADTVANEPDGNAAGNVAGDTIGNTGDNTTGNTVGNNTSDNTGGTAGNAASNATGNTDNSATGKTTANIAEIQDYVETLNKAEPQIISEPLKWTEKAAADTNIYWLLRKAAAYVRAHK